MNIQARNPLRSWVFVYIGLIATILATGQNADSTAQQAAEPSVAAEVVAETPLYRRDI